MGIRDQRTLKAVERIFDLVPGELNTIETSLDTIETNLDDLTEQVTAEVVPAIGQLRGQFTDLESEVDSLESEVDSLPSPVGKMGLIIDGSGSVLGTGLKAYVDVPYDCTIDSWSIYADQVGSAVVDVWKTDYANYPPVDGDSITASALPTLTSAIKAESSTLTGWTTSVSQGDIMGFNLDSVSTVTWLALSLRVTKI